MSDLDYAVKQILQLCRIPSPSGFTRQAVDHLVRELREMGLAPAVSRKGSVRVELGGQGDGLVLAAHVDTLGAMVSSIDARGRLKLAKIGGFPENYIESENCTIHTRSGQEYSGTVLLKNPAVHVNHEIADTKRTASTMEVVVDERVSSREDVKKLGIDHGDFISFEPRTVMTGSGFIKSRHLDDKASAGILLALARWVKEQKAALRRQVHLLFTSYEEVGHGGASGLPPDITEMICVDMGAVGEGLETDEFKVSICAKDSRSPYDYQVTSRLVELARKNQLNYAVDVYPFYGSDVDAALVAGHELRHGLIGPGVAASHGYERTHVEGIANTLALLKHYVSADTEPG